MDLNIHKEMKFRVVIEFEPAWDWEKTFQNVKGGGVKVTSSVILVIIHPLIMFGKYI